MGYPLTCIGVYRCAYLFRHLLFHPIVLVNSSHQHYISRYEDLDLDPVADMSIEFTSAGDTMKRAINCYGELSGDMPDDVTATPVSTTQYNEVGQISSTCYNVSIMKYHPECC